MSIPRLTTTYDAAIRAQLRLQAAFDTASPATRDAIAEKLASATERVSRSAQELQASLREQIGRKGAKKTDAVPHEREPRKTGQRSARAEALLQGILGS